MRRGAAAATLVLATLAVWAVMTWPLPRHAFHGIPSTARNTEGQDLRYMIPGDHLQLLYHFWLAADMLRGRTPLFHNLYEFNTGDDTSRREPGTYYFPFSLVFAVLFWAAGRAVAWNGTGWLSLLATLWLTWLLARRYARGSPPAAAAAVIGILLPYRWIALLGGSPTGFAMALVPMMFLGIDLAVRDTRPAGGWIAGAAVILAYCSDLHVFFFSVLAFPAWCLVACTMHDAFAWRQARTWWRQAVALAPALFLGMLAYVFSRATARELAGATMAEGWRLREVAAYSPPRAELYLLGENGYPGMLYIGYTVTILAGLALASMILGFRRRRGLSRSARQEPAPRRVQSLLCLLLLLVFAALVAMLALGTNGPENGSLLVLARKIVPPYRMVRQSAKIFCLMPTLLAVIGTLSLHRLFGAFPAGRRIAITAVAALVLLSEYSPLIRPKVCLLRDEQEGYAAVAQHAAATGAHPARAVALPLWPGDSHWASLYQHYASLYRLRLINGYRPAVPAAYFNDVFRRFESLNQGVITEDQLADLRALGFHYLLLHEDAFPEKVSPFPVSLTLRRLLNHPYLELLMQDEQVWAFRVRRQPEPVQDRAPHWTHLFPARRWELERVRNQAAQVTVDADAGGGLCLAFDAPNSSSHLFARAPVGNVPGLRWSLLARGKGRLGYRIEADDRERIRRGTIEVDSRDWTWFHAPCMVDRAFFRPGLVLWRIEGSVLVDLCILDGGPPLTPAPGETVRLPSPLFFHAGFTDFDADAVVLRRRWDPPGAVVYGALAPLERGRYTVSLEAAAEASPDARLGELRVLSNGTPLGTAPVRAGRRAQLSFPCQNPVPLRLEFWYDGRHDLSLGAFTLSRLE